MTNRDCITFSLYNDRDYDGFYACINDFYDGGYPYKEYLDRKNLIRLTESGDLVITLAKDSDGRVVGTSAAHRMSGRFEGSVLLLLRSVLKIMQGKGIGTKQEMFLLEQIKTAFPDTLSFYADVMTHNAVSQTTMLKQGFVFCGLRMALYKSEIIVPKLNYKSGTKMSQAIYCKNNGGPKRLALYAPQEHMSVLKELYGKLGVDVEFCLSDVSCLRESAWQITASENHKSAEMFADKHGNTEKLVGEIRKLIAEGFTAVAYINMSAPGCDKTYQDLRKQGFYFSGIKPLSSKGEYMVLSNSSRYVLDLNDIKVPEEALSLFQTVKKEIENEA